MREPQEGFLVDERRGKQIAARHNQAHQHRKGGHQPARERQLARPDLRPPRRQQQDHGRPGRAGKAQGVADAGAELRQSERHARQAGNACEHNRDPPPDAGVGAQQAQVVAPSKLDQTQV